MSSTTRVFVSRERITDGKAVIEGSDASHISRVLRLVPGDVITVCDMQRREYEGVILSVGKAVEVSLSAPVECVSEPECEITVYQALIKGDKFETVIQKSVELGATRIVPVLCERSVSRPDKSAMTSKTQRYRKISESAASQCGRGVVPLVEDTVTFKQAINRISESNCGFLCYEGDGTLHITEYFKQKRSASDVAFLIGPEGGISSAELEEAVSLSVPLIGLGKRILRTETAPLYVLAAVNLLIL